MGRKMKGGMLGRKEGRRMEVDRKENEGRKVRDGGGKKEGGG